MSNINEGNTNVERNEDEANRWHRTQRSPTIVSSGSSLDSFLMDFQGGADFLDGMNVALDSSDISDGNRDELLFDETSQLVMQINTVSSSSLLDQQNTYVNASASHVMQRVASSDQHVLPTSSSVAAASSNVPEFLYQLTKMLAQDNREVIEWSNGTFHTSRALFGIDLREPER
jgi:hypothetical protein